MLRAWLLPSLIAIGAYYLFIYSPVQGERHGPDADWDGATKTQFRPLASMHLTPSKYDELRRNRDFGKNII
jgi:hypothetical protein